MRHGHLLTAVCFAAVLTGEGFCADPIAVEDFSVYEPASPWTSPVDPWGFLTGKTWCIVAGEDGGNRLQSTETSSEDFGSAGQVYYRIDGLLPAPRRIVLEMQVGASGIIEPGANATLLMGFSKLSEMGSAPPSAFGINFQISTGPDGMAKTGVVRVELSGAGDSPDGLKAEIAPLLDVSAPFRLEIEVDAGGESVRARINEDAWSESVRLAYPWSEVRYMRIYQRLLQVRVKSIKFFE